MRKFIWCDTWLVFCTIVQTDAVSREKNNSEQACFLWWRPRPSCIFLGLSCSAIPLRQADRQAAFNQSNPKSENISSSRSSSRKQSETPRIDLLVDEQETRRGRDGGGLVNELA